MRLFDCFIMRDELDILKIRMETLKEHVDVFVIVEADKTFSGVSKPFVAEEVIKEYQNKEIRYIKVTDMPEVINEDRWPLEYHQRNAIMRGLTDLQDDDIVMISDLDEIWNPFVFDKSVILPIVFEQLPVAGFLNVMVSAPATWYGTMAIGRGSLDERTPQDLRMIKNGFPRIKGGWHFSWCGGRERMEIKAQTFCHTIKECEDKGYPGQIMRMIESMDGVEKIDINTLPKYIQDNFEYLKEKGLILA